MARLASKHETTGTWAEFTDSYRVSLPVVYRYLYRATGGDVPLTEDLTQATFLTAVRSFQAGRPEALAPAWLQTVARSRLIDHFRRQAREESKLRVLAGHRAPDSEVPQDLAIPEAQ